VRASARDAMPTTQFDPSLPTIPCGRSSRGDEDFNRLQLDLLNRVKAGEVPREEAQVKLEEFWVGALRRAVVEGDVEHGSLMAGQSVAFVKKIQPVREILDDLVTGAEAALARMAGEGDVPDHSAGPGVLRSLPEGRRRTSSRGRSAEGPPRGVRRPAERVRAIEEVEHKGDSLTHEIIRKLNTSFVTPIDREDILALASSLDDVIDLIEAAATRMLLFKVTEATPHAKELGFLILKCVQELQKGSSTFLRPRAGPRLRALRRGELPRERGGPGLPGRDRVPLREREGSHLHPQVERDLRDAGTATDRCEDAANVLEGVALKNA